MNLLLSVISIFFLAGTLNSQPNNTLKVDLTNSKDTVNSLLELKFKLKISNNTDTDVYVPKIFLSEYNYSMFSQPKMDYTVSLELEKMEISGFQPRIAENFGLSVPIQIPFAELFQILKPDHSVEDTLKLQEYHFTNGLYRLRVNISLYKTGNQKFVIPSNWVTFYVAPKELNLGLNN